LICLFLALSDRTLKIARLRILFGVRWR